ncbi:hypothetical protein [Maribacter arenosus]|uniref:DUF4890 domain-containing protein n=1 Tax=Maribacter arenosus TaxID=1854708 RepID=A0ABR7VJ28_9FLAO|nr:hypothetical protein [Maribacter arenosus]MBD0852537.1 hypothetical protein [Maribacter arenosus]
MKKVILLVVLMAGFTAMAQKGERGQRGEYKNMSAEQMATLQTKKMTLDLDLTQAQQTKVQALNLENAKKRKAQMEARKAQKESGEAKALTSDERFAMKQERLDAAIAHKAELKKILNEEQFAKWEMHHKKRGEHRKDKGNRSKGKKQG